MNKSKLTVDENPTNKRFDQYLAASLEWKDLAGKHSRSSLAKNITQGVITLNGKIVKPHTVPKEGDVIEFANLSSEQREAKPNTETTLDIMFSDEHSIVVNKPAGLLTHQTPQEHSRSVANILLAQFPEIASVGDDPLRPGIVHRLDWKTSGILIVARSQKSFDALKTLFKDRNVHKTYTALVHGICKDDTYTIDKPIARAASHRKQKIAEGKIAGVARDALTHITVLKRFGNHTLIEAHPKTGRMHQIRVHCASIGHGIVGDTTYGNKEQRTKNKELGIRHLLHASEMKFTLFEKDYSFEAPLPKDFEMFLKNLEK